MTLLNHDTEIVSMGEGYIGKCECGDRSLEPKGYGDAEKWCNRHQLRAKGRMLNAGSPPSLRVLERIYRENATNMVYEPEERAEWRRMADEIAAHVPRKKGEVMPDQIGLWDDEPAPRN